MNPQPLGNDINVTNVDNGGSVSIAMATYNGSAHLNEQLTSLLRQTQLPYEVCVCDDGSTDNTLEILNEFAASAPFPVLISTNLERLGFQDNFLKAATLCSGKYVAFCDQDDVWLPAKIEDASKALATTGALLAVHGAFVTDTALKTQYKLQHGVKSDCVYLPLQLQPFPGKAYGFTLVFDRAVLGYLSTNLRPDVPGQPGMRLYHDVWIALVASVFGKTVHLKRPLAYYRQHAGNVLGAKRNKLGAQLRGHLHSPLNHYRWRADYARHFANALRVSAEDLAETLRGRAMLGGSFYETVAQTYEERSNMLDTPQVLQRLMKLALMITNGRYKAHVLGGLGFSSMLKDCFSIFLCIFGTQFTKRQAIETASEPQTSKRTRSA